MDFSKEVTLTVGQQFAGQIGRVYDTYIYIYSGDSRSNQIVGSIIVDDQGIGKFYIRRESRYMILFPGYIKRIYYDYGNPENYKQINQYAIPEKPNLNEIRNEDLQQIVGYNQLRIYWQTSKVNNVLYEVQTRLLGETDWIIRSDNINAKTFLIKFAKEGIFEIRLRGKNKANQFGGFSNIVDFSSPKIKVSSNLDDVDVSEPYDAYINL